MSRVMVVVGAVRAAAHHIQALPRPLRAPSGSSTQAETLSGSKLILRRVPVALAKRSRVRADG